MIEAVQHPNADRLRACKVDTGDGIVSVVCGAPNAHTGMKAVFAAPGAFIPGTGITLKVGEIRGVQSAGMLLSAREMGLGDDHAGIIELPADAPVGMSYPSMGRAGRSGHRDQRHPQPRRLLLGPRRGPRPRRRRARHAEAVRPGRRSRPLFDGGPRWEIAFPEACPWIIGRTIRGVKNSPSPKWLQDRLTFIGLRPINALVDVTNFFTFDLGRPLHVFDVGEADRRRADPAARRRRDDAGAERQGLCRRSRGLRDLRRRRRAVDRRRDRRRGHRLRRNHHQRVSSNAPCSIRSASP